MIVNIYTDGACSCNPGPGGWGAILSYGNHTKSLSGCELMTTNNRMELMAAIAGLQALKKSCTVIITTDSKYVKDGITTWIEQWKKNHWKTKAGKAVKNQDLWQQLDCEIRKHQVTWQWVKGHNGHPENEAADLLARNAIANLQKNQSKEP